MTFEQLKKATKEQLIEYGKTLPLGYTKDKYGNLISYRDGYGYWWEKKYKNGKQTSYSDSYGDWLEWTYKDGNLISFRNSHGYYKVKGKRVSEEEYDKFMKGDE